MSEVLETRTGRVHDHVRDSRTVENDDEDWDEYGGCFGRLPR